MGYQYLSQPFNSSFTPLLRSVYQGFGGCFVVSLANAGDFSDRFQARPSMLCLQPVDVCRNRDAARFDAAMIGIDRGMFRRGLCQRVVVKHADISVLCALIALEREGVIAALIDDLLGDRTLTIERVDSHDGSLTPWRACENLPMNFCNQSGAELFRIKEAEHPREGVVARQSLFELQELPKNASFSRANSSISEAYCPPHSTVHSAMTMISTRSYRPALPVRGSAKSSKQTAKPSIRASNRGVLDATARIDSRQASKPNSNVNPVSNAIPPRGLYQGLLSSPVYGTCTFVSTQDKSLMPTPMQRSTGIADLLLASKDRSARAHASFVLPTGAMLIIPRNGPARRGGLAIYNPLRVTGLAAKSLMWSGVWSGQEVHVSAEAMDELHSVLADLLGERHVECAFQLGATGIYSKIVILVMDTAGRPLAYAKLAALATAQQALQHEIATLERLSTVAPLRGRVPHLLGRTKWREFPVVLMSPGPVKRAPRVFGAAHHEFLSCLREATRTPGILVECPMWHAATLLLARWGKGMSPAWRDRYDWALVHLQRQLGRTQLDLSLAHRDFAPWNTRTDRNAILFVFDWEFSKGAFVPGSDFFHFHIALWAMLGRAIDGDVVTNLIAAASREGISNAEDMFLAFLIDIALFEHDAILREGKQHHPVLEIAAQGIDILRRRRS